MMSGSGHPGKAIPASRRRLYMAILLSFPLLVIVSIEALLRLSGFGAEPEFFVEEHIGDRTYVRMNYDIARRYFPNLDVAPAASIDIFPAKKRPGVRRIFFLGASSMLGYPYMNNVSASAIIRDALRRPYPDTTWEVVNVSMTAVTSHFVREFGRECLRYDPDLLVVYAGHNEYYGGLGVASTELVGPLWLTRLYLQLQEYRVVQALSGLLRALFGAISNDQEVSGTLMEALAREREIQYDSHLFHAGIEVFRENISSLIEEAQDRQVPVLLSTVISNLRGLRPFQPVYRSGLSETDTAGMGSLLQEYLATQGSDGDNGRDILRRAYDLDTTFAMTHFLLGRQAEADSDDMGAYTWYATARDHDGLRFRASGRLNDAIRSFEGSEGVSVVDADSLIRQFAEHGVPGNDLLHEHVHFTVGGYERLATVMYPALNRALGLPEVGPGNRDVLPARVTPIDTMAASMRLDILLNSWPFTTTRRSLADLRPEGWEQELAFKYLDGIYTWEQLHVLTAERYETDGRLADAAAEYESLRAATPHNVSPYLRLGNLCLKMKDAPRARSVLEASLLAEETSNAHMMLGQVAYEQRRFGDAVVHLRKALSLGNMDVRTSMDIRLSLAVALHRSGRNEEALDEVRRLLSMHPDFNPAREFEAFLMR